MQTHIRIFESPQLEGSYVGDLLYIQYLVVNYNGKESEKIHIYFLNHFAAHLKLTHYCKSTTVQLKQDLENKEKVKWLVSCPR